MGQPNRTELLRGTLEMIVLRLVATSPDHGHALVNRIAAELGEEFLVDHGSLYPALYRMETRGLITYEWRITAQNRRAKYYTITSAGRARLSRDVREWNRFVATIQRFLDSRTYDRPTAIDLTAAALA